ncbi:protein KTI12 homolog isoform X2 [Condylostylus longicornis]|nr:protein KTI12 homolog isoform X2 [Condylostylus longicornis]
MPLIVISGYPSSCKTTKARELAKYFEEKGKVVKVVSENIAVPKAGFRKNEYFSDSQKEKTVRSDLKSEVIRLLNKQDLVIFDSSNYIKGYRYEIFCATKAARTTQCTLFCAIQKELAWKFNKGRNGTDDNLKNDNNALLDNSDVPYDEEVFNGLCLRYEEPHGNCRWDSPLFVSFPNDILDFQGIYDALFESKPLVPNQSTQNPPLSSTNHLFELDKLTQEIVSDITAARKIGILGPVSVKATDVKVNIPDSINAIQLNRLRKQFLNYTKLHTNASSLDKAPQLFVQFLNSNFNK